MNKEVVKEYVKARKLHNKHSHILYLTQCEMSKETKDYDRIRDLLDEANVVANEFEEQFKIYRATKKRYQEVV